MTVSTRYVVVDSDLMEIAPSEGDTPGANAAAGNAAEAQTKYSEVIDKAEQLGVDKITLGELLQQMGWKDRTNVVEFGLGADPRDFRPRAPPGGPKVSSGNVSGLYPRRPTRRQASGRGGAY